MYNTEMKLKFRLYVLILLVCIASWANAVPSIGTIPLLYGDSNASDVIMSKLDEAKIGDPNAKLGVRRIILSEIVTQMIRFQPLLDKTLTESGSYLVYDAKPVIQSWKNTNPKLLDTFHKTTSVALQTNNTTITQVTGSTAASVHKFVLLGWVDNIHEKESRTPIQGTNKVALIYSLDIRCEYRLVNPDTNRVVAVFIGAGHGGIARILGAGHIPINFDAKLIVGDMFDSLAENIHHVLLVRRAEYIKRRINAKKIDINPK
jgi:hypothetical protein